MEYQEALEIYMAAVQAKIDSQGLNGVAMYPSESCSYLKNGVWYLHNHYQFLGKVGTKCKCLIETQAD